MNTSYFETKADLFEKEISNKLSTILTRIDGENNTEWTKAVYKILFESVKKHKPHIMIAATQSKLEEANNKEWLYDFVCYENNDDGGLNDVFLVAECEWKNPWGNDEYIEDVQYDFEKLMVARSSHRLLVFEENTKEEVEEHIGYFKSIIHKSKLSQNGDRYMFSGWIDGKEFLIDLYIH